MQDVSSVFIIDFTEMRLKTPDISELEDFFYDRCPQEKAAEIEDWFRRHGDSDEAGNLLRELWCSLDITDDEQAASESRKAFGVFRSRLNPEAGDFHRRKIGRIFRNAGRVAAVLFIPLLAFSIWQVFMYHNDVNVAWTSVRTPYGEKTHLFLPDSTEVWLNAGSSIVYPEKFSGNTRTVFFSGEAYFDVAVNQHKVFEINTADSKVRVFGTEFNLKSYDDDDDLELALVEGRVSFVPEKSMEGNETYLQPGDMIKYDRTNRQLDKYRFDAQNYSCWKEGRLYFKNCPLDDIAQQLSRTFGTMIIIRTDSLKTMPYHMAFVNGETLDEILSIIDRDPRIRIRKTGDIVEIY